MTRIIRPREGQRRLGIGHTKYYADIKTGRLPPLVRLGPRCVGHIEEELDAHIQALRAERQQKPASSERLIQEIGAASSSAAARAIVENSQELLGALPARRREQVLAQLEDLIGEK